MLGANGAGKSTFLALLSGFMPDGVRSEGDLRLHERPLGELTPRERARAIAYLPQHPEVPEGLDVFETVLLGRSPYRSSFEAPSSHDRQRVEQALERFELTALRSRKPRALSGGERQRMHLARIMVQDASIWLLDEPYGHLDFRHQRAVLDLLAALARDKDILVVVVAHDLLFLPQAASHLLLLRQGEALAAGTKAEVWTAANAELTFGVAFTPHEDMLWPTR